MKMLMQHTQPGITYEAGSNWALTSFPFQFKCNQLGLTYKSARRHINNSEWEKSDYLLKYLKPFNCKSSSKCDPPCYQILSSTLITAPIFFLGSLNSFVISKLPYINRICQSRADSFLIQSYPVCDAQIGIRLFFQSLPVCCYLLCSPNKK